MYLFINKWFIYFSLFRLVRQQLSINPLTYLHPWNSLTHFQRCHVDIQLTLVHQIRNYKCRWYHLAIFTIKQCLPFTQHFIQLLTYHVKIQYTLDVIVKRQVQIFILIRWLELWHLFVLIILNEIDQTFYS